MDFKALKEIINTVKGGGGLNTPLLLAALCIGVAIFYLILAFI